MRNTLFAVLATLITLSAAAQAPKKTFTEKLDGIKTTDKELTKNASTDNSSVGQSGVMSTSIPLVTVTSRTMSFPLQLEYSSGITVDQQSGPVGLGWALPVGSITRDYGAYEPDYSSTYHEADMFNVLDEGTGNQLNKGHFATANGSDFIPFANNQYLGYDAIENDEQRQMPLSDKYHVQVPGAFSNSFWNSGTINGSHNWTLTEFENWKISHTVKTYTVSQEYSRINEVNLQNVNGVMQLTSSYASAIGVLPYVKNGYAKAAVSGSNSFIPSESERVVRYEDFESFVITDADGTRYVFGRALRGQKYVFSDDPYWSNKDANGSPNSPWGNFWKIDYIAEWLLTEIQSVDYVDLNNNGIADDGDAGDWIRFEYTAPEKTEETSLAGQTSAKISQKVPTHREWSNFSQTDRASSLMRELAYLTRIVTPTQVLDFTISERYDVDHDYYTKPANRVGNSYYYEDRKYVSSGSTSDFDIEYPVETMKYDTIRLTSKLINKTIYPNENTLSGAVVLKYAAKGSAEELAVSSYLIRNNNKQEKVLSNGQLVGKPSRSADFNMEEYYSTSEKRGKTTLLGIELFGSDMSVTDKNSYTFEYTYNPSYDEIHKREIVRLYHFPSLRQGSSATNIPQRLNKAEHPIAYQQMILNANGTSNSPVSHTSLSPYDFLIEFPYQENYHTFSTNQTAINVYAANGQTNEQHHVVATPITHPLKPIKDVFGYLYADNCTTCASAWSLTKITYPTGGQVSFEYEQGTFTASTEWNLQANQLPILKEYNELARKRSYVQDAYNRYTTNAQNYSNYGLSPKTLTATYEVALPTTYGIRLKKKTINDRINPVVEVTYEYETGKFTALPSAYIQSVIGGFNQFITRENYRHNHENGNYLMSGMGYSYDFQEKMSYLARTNIALDDYASIFFYQAIKEKKNDNSALRTVYGPIQGNVIDYPVYNLYCFRLPSASWGIRMTLAGDNVNRLPISIVAQEYYAAGAATPYQRVDFTYERIPILLRSLTVDYTINTQNPNTVKLWNNDFEVWMPDVQDVTTYMYYNNVLLHNELYLPYGGSNSYSYQRWGQFKMLLKKKVTNYKGLASHTEYLYDNTTHMLRQEKSYTLNFPETYFKVYEYAFETYNTLTNKFHDLNMINYPSKTTAYLNSVAPSNALSAVVQTFDYSFAVPKPLDAYQYETDNVDPVAGTFTLPAFSASNQNWRVSESDIYQYNRAANPVSTRSNQLYNKMVAGNGLNSAKATFSGTERAFDATYSGFEDLNKRLMASAWNASSYLEEDWFTNEYSTATVTGKTSSSGYALVCNNSSYFTAGGSNQYHIVSTNVVTDLAVGDQVTVFYDYSSATYQFTSEIAAILPESVLPDQFETASLNYVVCFTTVPNFPAVDPLSSSGGISNTVISKNTPVYRVSSAYSRTGEYSYKLPTIRVANETAKRTPIRPVKIDQQAVAPECSNPTNGITPLSCYWDYQASIWLKYDLDIPLSTPTQVAVTPQSNDLTADAIYRRGTVNTSTNQGVKIICDIWNADRTLVMQQLVFYPQSVNTAWQQFTVDIPILKGNQQWIDVYVQNDITQIGATFSNARSVYVDDIVVCPKEAKYSYSVYDKFGNMTFSVNNDDVYAQTTYDVKGRQLTQRNPYGKTVHEIAYFEHANWTASHNHLTERNWVANGSYSDTRYYLDGFGKIKQAMVSDYSRNLRMVSETNILNSKGQVTTSYKPYYLNSYSLGDKYDGNYASRTQALYGSDYAYTSVTYEAVPEDKIAAVYPPRKNAETAIVSTQSDYVNASVVTHPYLSVNPNFAIGTVLIHQTVNPLGKITRTYMDNLGRVIMEEHEIGNQHTQNTDGSISFTATNLGFAQTWFVYDGAGRITATYDPDGKKTEYFYNSLGLVVKSVSPDKGVSEMRYDKYGQVRFVKNAKDYEAIQNNIYGCDQFKYSKFDKWGREIESGVLTVAPNSLGGNPSSPPFPTAEFFDDYTKINDQSFPSSTQPFVQVHNRTTYDGSRTQYSSTAALSHTVYSDHSFDASAYQYFPQKTDVTTFAYMADGQLAKTTYNYAGLAGQHDITMVYNDMRLPIGKDYTNSVNSNYNFKWRTSVDNLARPILYSNVHNGVTTQTGKNYYDPMGNLLMVGVGTTGVSSNPHVDYQVIKKDIRDQVTSIMSKYFRAGLTYDVAGNITNQYWSNELLDPTSGASFNINQYAYTYDKMNRLIGADYKQSTLTYNPFVYFNSMSGSFPNDFSCVVREREATEHFQTYFTEFETNIADGIDPERSKTCINALNQLLGAYITNNVLYSTMDEQQLNRFFNDYNVNSRNKGIDPIEFEWYEAKKFDDQDHMDYLANNPVATKSFKYTQLLLAAIPWVGPVDCTPNPNATAYGYLPDFTMPVATSNLPKYDEAFWYTENGNMTKLHRNDNDVTKTIQNYTYANALNNRLTSVTWTVGNAAPVPYNYGYDASGNLLNDSKNNVSAISYSSYDDLPTAIANTTGTHKYRYMAGQRSVKEINANDREYYIDDIVLNQSGQVKSYQTATGYATPNTSNGVDYFYNVKDWLGTTRTVITSTGTILNAADNYAYGKKLPGRNTFNSSYEGYRYQFTGHELDGETGYQYHGARYYNEELGRYMSVDRFAMKFFHQSSYVYAGNMPINALDVNGDSIAKFDYKTGNFIKFVDDGKSTWTYERGYYDKKDHDRWKVVGKGYFNDPENDIRAIKNKTITRIEVLSDAVIEKQIIRSGVRSKAAQESPMDYAKKSAGNKMDYGVQGVVNLDLKKNTFYVRSDELNGTTYNYAYNVGDIGNYIWGYGMAELGILSSTAQLGAHYYTTFHGRDQKTPYYDFGPGTYGGAGVFDTFSDQKAIARGHSSNPKGKQLTKSFYDSWPTSIR